MRRQRPFQEHNTARKYESRSDCCRRRQCHSNLQNAATTSPRLGGGPPFGNRLPSDVRLSGSPPIWGDCGVAVSAASHLADERQAGRLRPRLGGEPVFDDQRHRVCISRHTAPNHLHQESAVSLRYLNLPLHLLAWSFRGCLLASALALVAEPASWASQAVRRGVNKHRYLLTRAVHRGTSGIVRNRAILPVGDRLVMSSIVRGPRGGAEAALARLTGIGIGVGLGACAIVWLGVQSMSARISLPRRSRQ